MATEHEWGPENKTLVVFDVEGVLIPKNRYLLFEISRKVSFFGFIRIIVLGFLYEIGFLSLESALKRIFKMLKGLEEEEAFRLYKQIPLMLGTEEVFDTLNKKGFFTALISSGLPTSVVEDLAKRLKVNFAYGIDLETINGRLTGKIGGDVLKSGGKAVVLNRILEKEKLSTQDCIMVADDRNNLSMFPLCRLRIGYNPDFVLSAKSDFVTRGGLTEVLLPITEKSITDVNTSISRKRGLREIIHISSFFTSFICIYLTGNILTSSLILVVALFYVLSEVSRVSGTSLPILSSITMYAANKTEFYELATAPFYFALGIALSLLIFPEPISYVAITVLTLGDGFAHVFGMKFGRTRLPFNKGKNLEGSVFGLFFAFFGSLIFVDPIRALIAATFGMMLEALPLPINDNITIPFGVGILLIALI